MQLSEVLALEQAVHLLAGLNKLVGFQIGQGQVISIDIMGGIKTLRLFEIREAFSQLPGVDVELTQIMICFEALRVRLDSLPEPAFGFREKGSLRSFLTARWRGALREGSWSRS